MEQNQKKKIGKTKVVIEKYLLAHEKIKQINKLKK